MKKIIVIGVIILFIVVGFQPALAVEPKVSENTIEKEEDCDCEEVSDINITPHPNATICLCIEIISIILYGRAGFWEFLSYAYQDYGLGILSAIFEIRANKLYDKAEQVNNLALYYDCPTYPLD